MEEGFALFRKKENGELSMVVHTYNSSTSETEMGRS
jgi:hypothetical protein